jgi:hypothetical protein
LGTARRRPGARRGRHLAALSLPALVAALALALALAATAGAHPANRHKREGEPQAVTPKVAITFTCTTVTFTYAGFRPEHENTVTERIKSDGTTIYKEHFTFTGPEATHTVSLNPVLAAGKHLVKAGAQWRTNGLVGESGNKRQKLTCAAAQEAKLSVQKLQEIAESGGQYTQGELPARAGQTVLYKIVVTNSGNTPLVITSFADPHCDPGTIHGGQGETPLAPTASTTYTCSHLLGEGGSYSNTAEVTARPQEGGAAKTQPSNTVVVSTGEKPAYEIAKLQQIAGAGGGYTAATLSATVGQTVEYEIVLKNTGNTAITFSEFTDIYCDPGTLTGGPSGALAAGASAAYHCTRRLAEAVEYENIAFVKGATAAGWKREQASNLVKVKVGPAGPTTGTTTGGSGGGAGGGPGSTTGTSGAGGSTGKPAGSTGVLPSKHSHKASKKKKARHTTTSHRTPRFTG